MAESERPKPKLTGDPEVDVTLLIYFVAPQLTGERPLRDGDQEIIEEISRLQRENKLTPIQKDLLFRISLWRAIEDDF